MNRNARGRILAAVLFACAVAVVGLAVAGVLEFRASRGWRWWRSKTQGEDG